ncbi:MAG: hypothetical protein QOI73_380, partial [Solirubrobacteraceae bacterium]|nr:hypothetical protein [Solirubrobacteraceae bacterium]
MEQSTATRRLVKSPPELWAELSSEDSLGRHLAAFGEIRITRVDPQTTVAWEGDRVSGTVELAPTGWGTKVVLTATPDHAPAELLGADDPPDLAGGCRKSQAEPDKPPAPVLAAAPAPAPPQVTAAPPPPRRGFFARLFRRR